MRGLAVVFGLSAASLGRDRPALVLTFVLPLVFFTIFASVFGAMDRREPRALAVGLTMVAPGEFSIALVEKLAARPTVTLSRVDPVADEEVRRWFADGLFDALIVLPARFERAIEDGETAPVEVLTDASNPLTAPAVSGELLQALVETGAAFAEEDEPVAEEPVRITVRDVVGGAGREASTAFYAAGLGVLFLMISLTNRAGLLLDDRENGTLERMLMTQLSLAQYLAGRGTFLLVLGLVQITAMFSWAAVAFDLALLAHLPGFAVMATLSALCATAFALLVVLICRSREQLTAASIVVVLLLAAVGGNLFPRFLMPEWLQAVGWLTFNGWALDGFQQVFWYGSPLSSLLTHVLVLAGTTLLLLLAVAALAPRWSRS